MYMAPLFLIVFVFFYQGHSAPKTPQGLTLAVEIKDSQSEQKRLIIESEQTAGMVQKIRAKNDCLQRLPKLISKNKKQIQDIQKQVQNMEAQSTTGEKGPQSTSSQLALLIELEMNAKTSQLEFKQLNTATSQMDSKTGETKVERNSYHTSTYGKAFMDNSPFNNWQLVQAKRSCNLDYILRFLSEHSLPKLNEQMQAKNALDQALKQL